MAGQINSRLKNTGLAPALRNGIVEITFIKGIAPQDMSECEP